MKTIIALVLIVAGAAIAGFIYLSYIQGEGRSSSRTPALTTQVYTSPGNLAVTSTIVSGPTEAAVIDAQFLLSDARKVADKVKASGKTLKYVYVTHPHPDHYFGLVVFKFEFPEAKLVALPKVVEGVKAGWDARLDFWKGTGAYAVDDLPTEHAFPDPLEGNSLTIDGAELKIVGPVQGDSPGDNSYVWIPSIKTVVGGDILFSNAHFPLGGLPPEQRMAWAAVLDEIAALGPVSVIPGHEGPNAPHDASVLDFMKGYIAFFNEAQAASASAAELEARVKEKYPGLGLEGLLTFSAGAAFPPPPQTPAGE